MSHQRSSVMARLHSPHRRSAPALRVLVVDDHRTFAEMLAAALDTVGMTAVGTAHSSAEAVAMAEALQPDVVVMDIQLPDQDGLSTTRRILQVAPATRVAVVTAHRDPDWITRAAQAGASAFISKAGPLTEVI